MSKAFYQKVLYSFFVLVKYRTIVIKKFLTNIEGYTGKNSKEIIMDERDGA